MTDRIVTREYQDPLDLIWLHCAQRLGIQVMRDDEVFASWDGESTLRLGTDSLDPDDSVAQLVLHELCHGLVEGQEAFRKADWGLNEEPPRPRLHEFATLRVQASLCDRYGLRRLLAATTVFREYYDLLPVDALGEVAAEAQLENLRPLKPGEDQLAIGLARGALARFSSSSWQSAILRALEQTRKIFDVVRDLAGPDSVWCS